jgi:hypothetical protein
MEIHSRTLPNIKIMFILMLTCLFSIVYAEQELPSPLNIQVFSAVDAKPIEDVTVHVGGRMAVSDQTGKVVLDGIPAGTYEMWARQPGHREFRQTIELKNGVRASQTMSLIPEALLPLKFRFVEDISSEPVASARIHMVPRAVSAALQGSMVFATDNVGSVATIAVPEGLYHLTVEAPGYVTLEQDVEHKATDKPLEFKLKAIVKPMSCTIAVTDEGGKALPNADVELWEVYPMAKIISGQTTNGGSITFSNLRIGTINPVTRDKLLPVTHRAEAVVRVQVKGYVTALQSVRLTDGGRLVITVSPQKIVLEQQANESKGDAQRLVPGQSVSLKIDKPTDQDWFTFDLRESTRVHLAFNNCPIEVLATIFDTTGKSIATLGKYAAAPATGAWDLSAGRYWLQVTEWGMNGSSDAEVTMDLTTEIAADPLESNNSAPEAKPIQIGQHMRGIILPVGDTDQFTLHLDRAGCLRLESTNTPAIERAVEVFDRNEKRCAALYCYANAGGSGEWQIAAGDYRVVVSEWGNNGSSLDPYDFRVLFMTDDGIDDPVNRPGMRISAVRNLPLYSRTYATINPLGDRDIYTVSIPSKGTLHVYQQGSTELTTRVLDSQGNMLKANSSYANNFNQTTHPFTGPITVYLEVSEWGDNGWSPFPYELRTWFDPAGELERLQDNDSLQTAAPIELGTMIRDNILPTGDQDWYQLVVDQPGILNVWMDARPELNVALCNATGKSIANMSAYWNTQNQANWDVRPGIYYLLVTEWGNNGEAAWDYALKATLNRAVPGETADPAKSPAVTLKIGEARPCGIEQIGDVERFRVSIPAKGEYTYFMGGPIETAATATDIRTGKSLFTANTYGSSTGRQDFNVEGPMELELTVTEWGNNGESIQPNWIMVATRGLSLLSPAVNWTVDAIQPTKVTFTLANVPGVASLPVVSLDINADGNPDSTLGQGQSRTLEFPAQGLYRVTSWGTQGPVSARGEFWVQATGQPVRKGMRVLIATPGEGEFIDNEIPVRVTAMSYEGKAIRQVQLQVNGRIVGTDYTLPYEFGVPWQTLAGGNCTLTVVALDTAGKCETAVRKVQVSDYFNLLPAEGTTVTGNEVTVSWDGGEFGPAKVRYRLKGDGKVDTPWKEVIGQNARARRVRIADLEAGKPYEYQPLGGTEPGPIREVTRVKGLAFTQNRYGGTIQRDYDQKIPVAVRNYAEEKRIVHLRCDQPQNSNLLVAFVGDGEKNRPVELKPGEQRAFTLGFSAQDVTKELHMVPIYIESEDGYSDQAEVEVCVKLPKVDLEWIDVTAAGQEGLGRTYELINKGDTLTDVNVAVTKDNVRISPEVKHGLIQAGQRTRFEVYPKIQEGFTGCEDIIQATSIGKTASIGYEGKLKPGEQVFRINMTAGLDPVTGEPADVDAARRAAHRLIGQYLSPAAVDWTTRIDPRDTDRDGKPDRWTVVDNLNQTMWFGRDTDGDGEVDFAQADVGLDGEIDHSSMLEKGRWQTTNLLDAWLEMNFAVPEHRSQYQAHDLDLIVNGRVVGQLKQTIPEGNYRFPLNPTALTWAGGENQLEISSHFQNFAHYAISSDFQLKTRLLGTNAYMVGTSREDAVNRLLGSDRDFTTYGVDYSISSADLDVTPKDKLQPGSLVHITGTIRNLGVGSGDRLDVALFLAVPGTQGKELMRQTITSPGMMTDSSFEFIWPAAPGNHSLRVVADPDGVVRESNRKNNAAIVGVVVPGDDAPPVLTVFKPERDMTATNGDLEVLATAVDAGGIIGMDLSVDGGMSQPLYRTTNGFEGIVQLQPGTHSLQFKVTDSGGMQAQEIRTVKVEAARPQCRIISPTAGATIDTSETRVLVSAPNVVQVCVRVNRGPWLDLRPTGDMWGGRVDLPFGRYEIETLVIDKSGVRQTQTAAINCTAQPEELKKETLEKQEATKRTPLQVGGQESDQEVATLGKQSSLKSDPQTQTYDSGARPALAGSNKPAQPTSGGNAKTQTTPNQDYGQTGGSAPTGGTRPDQIIGTEMDQAGAAKARTIEADASAPRTIEYDRARPANIPQENNVTPPPGIAAPTPRPYTPPASTESAAPGIRRTPAGFAVNRQRNDWYCPNRPKIGINFKLPEWLTKEEFEKILKKGPNSPEFRALEAKLLAAYWKRGFGRSTNGQTIDQLLLKYKELLLKRCDRLEQAGGKLPSFLQSLGFAAEDPPTDPRELEAWRNKMKELTEIYWLRLLATEDPSIVVEGMRQRMDALSKYDEGAQLEAQAIIETIQANQKITQDVLEALPYTGEALDLIAAVTGESLSGEQLSGWERFFRAACSAGPAALEEALKRSPRAQEAIGQFLAAAGEMSGDMKSALLRRIGADIDKFDQFTDDAIKFLTKERSVFGRNADDVVDAAKAGYRQTAEGIEDLRTMEKAKDASRQSINELDDLVKKGRQAGDAEMEDVILKIQRDKTAQSLMNGAEVPDEVRKKANETIKRIYSDTDVPTMNRIKNSEEVRKYARDHGLDPDTIESSVWSPTNKRGTSTVDPDFKKYGRDRDVTYQITGKTKDGRTVTLDINHDVSGPIYKEELYKRCHGGNLPPGDAAERARVINQFADDTDQMVTSRWHREAYNTGPDVAITDWLNNDITPPVARPEDIRDTMITKSEHWFHQASQAGGDAAKYSRDTAEGMRQATKQWDNIVSKRIALYNANVPPQLEKAIDIFKQVDKGNITPKQAEHMLEQLGNLSAGGKLTPQKVVEDMAHYFEAMEKGPGKAFRSIKTAELANALESVNDLSKRTELINEAYRGGQISGETFRQMREGSFRLPPNPTTQQKQQLKDWAIGAWSRRAISLTEKKIIEEQTGPLDN